MNRSTRSHDDVVLPMPKPDATIHASHVPLFKTARNDPHDDLPISTWEATLSEESVRITAGVIDKIYAEPPGEVKHCPIESHRNENEDMIAPEVKYAVKGMLANQLSKMVEESLDDVLRKTLHNAQSSISFVVYNVIAHVMLDLLCKKVIS